MAKTASLAAMVTSLTTEKDITNMVEARKATATVAVRITTIEKGEKVIVLLIILALIMERTVRREVVTVIARSVHTETVPTIMKEENSVLLTILVLTTIMVDVRSVRTLLVSTTTRKEENSVHIVRALTMHNRVENSARIVLVLTTQQGGYGRPQGGYRPRTADYNPNAKYSMKKQIEYKELLTDPDEPIRLNKFLANAGICSRREADEFITAGVVSVNGEIVTELGTKVKRSDEVKFHDQPVNIERKVYVLLNKPKDCVTTSDDPQERKTVMDFVKGACKERIYPVGRLDRNTTGVLLLTNDGDLASKLTHPKFLKKKIYHVYCDKNVTKADLDQIVQGITLDDGEIHADAISYASDTDKSQVGIEIHSGKNRIVRRIFESLGYRVIKLDRVYFAGLTKKGLRRGDWRYLTEQEVAMLRMGSFE